VQLTRALRLEPGLAVAFTGAGGKSTALQRLAEEATRAVPVLLTTSTHLGLEQASMAETHIVLPVDGDLEPARIELARHKSVLVTGPRMLEEPRWTSPGEAALAQLHALAQETGGVLAVEADGSRGKPIKAPAAHEPLVPNFTNILVPVVGASAFDQPLSAAWVHRPERAAEVMGIVQGELLSPERVAGLIGSPLGGLKGAPPNAEVRVLINQVDDDALGDMADLCARHLLKVDAVRAVVLGSAGGRGAVREVRGRVAGVILAAGGSERMGRPKLLEAWKGEPLIRYALRGAVEGSLDPIVVVLGDRAEALRLAIGDFPVRMVVNQDWRAGQSTSLRLGLQAVEAQSEAVVFLLGDMPLVKPDLIRLLRRTHAASLAAIVLPTADGRRGNPVLFDRSTFGALTEVEGDRGGRAIFDRFEIQAVEGEARAFFDLDTEEDLEWLEGQT
jgi:molybdenum cofactor cytidylyltransferase